MRAGNTCKIRVCGFDPTWGGVPKPDATGTSHARGDATRRHTASAGVSMHAEQINDEESEQDNTTCTDFDHDFEEDPTFSARSCEIPNAKCHARR